jgi:hypothetical protein
MDTDEHGFRRGELCETETLTTKYRQGAQPARDFPLGRLGREPLQTDVGKTDSSPPYRQDSPCDWAQLNQLC